MSNAIIFFGLLGAYAIVGVWVLIEAARFFGKDATSENKTTPDA